MERYQTAVERAKEGRHWILLVLLKMTPADKRIEVVKTALRQACENRDDNTASQLYACLQAVVDDLYLEKFLIPEGSRGFLNCSDEMKIAKLAAQTLRSDCAIEIYRTLPSPEKGAFTPVLLETKRAMICDVARCWQETPSEETADQIFDFLCQLNYHRNDTKGEERKMVLDSLRNFINAGFSIPRLTRHILALSKMSTFHPLRKDMLRWMTVARANNLVDRCYSGELELELSVLQHLHQCSSGGYKFVAHIAQQIKLVDASVRYLADVIRGSLGMACGANVQISYNDLTDIVIDVNIIGEDPTSSSWLRMLHDYFEKARDQIIAWKQDPDKDYRYSRVTLRVNVMGCQSDATPVQSRKETF